MEMSLYDTWFATSHEMRHLWQMRSGNVSVSRHVQSSCISLDAYNRQPHEIDANAWAVLIMESTFGVTPLLANNVGSEIYEAIRRRAEEIAERHGKEENNDLH